MLEPRDFFTHPAIIIEFKVKQKNQTLDEAVDNALQQIEDRKYEIVLLQQGISSERIYKYGFAFDGKDVLIKSV